MYVDFVGKTPIYFSKLWIIASSRPDPGICYCIPMDLAELASGRCDKLSKNAAQMGRSFWRSAHIRYFSQLKFA